MGRVTTDVCHPNRRKKGNYLDMNISKKFVHKPWGYEEIWANTAKYVGKILVIKPADMKTSIPEITIIINAYFIAVI